MAFGLALHAQSSKPAPSLRVGVGNISQYIGPDGRVQDVDFFGEGTFMVTLDADIWSNSKGWSIGFYLDLANCGRDSVGDLLHYNVVNYVGPHWGISARYHLLTALGVNSSAWDVSLNGSLGAFWYGNHSPQPETNFGATVAYYPSAHWGCFMEYHLRPVYFTPSGTDLLSAGPMLLKLGVSYRF